MGRQTILLVVLLVLPACSRCSGSTSPPPDAATDAGIEAKIVNVDVLPPPAGWSFTPVRLGPTFPSVALPEGCSMREPLVHAKVKTSSRFVAVGSTLSTLVIADVDDKETPPRLVGVAAMTLDASAGTSNPIALPWTDAGTMPRLAHARSGEWLAAYAEPAAGKLSEVFVFQKDSAISLGEGDKFEAVDMACHDETCLLLTTRLSQVSAAGADVWIGKPSEAVTSWQRREIIPTSGDSDARPSCIARIDASWSDAQGQTSRGAVVALFEDSELVFWALDAKKEPHELGKVPATYGIVDASVLGRPVAFVYGAPVNDDGCAQQGGVMRFARPNAPDVEVRAPAPATNGSIRPLAHGGLATYLAPLGCGETRKVAYAIVLGEDGAPVSQPMPISDASSYAVTTEREKVDLWVQREEEVVWIRAKCAAP